MRYTAYLSITWKEQPLSGSVCLPDHDDEPGKMSCVPIIGFEHGSPLPREKEPEPEKAPQPTRYFYSYYDPFARPPKPDHFKDYEKRGVWVFDDRPNFNSWDYTRKHEDITVVIPLEKIAIDLYNLICKDDPKHALLKTVELYFYRYDEERHEEKEYFRITLEHAIITQVKQWFDNVKDGSCENRGPMIQLQFRYQRITWLHIDGYLIHTDEWEDGFGEYLKRDFKAPMEYGGPEPLAPLTISIQKVVIDESKAPIKLNERFYVNIEATVSRKFQYNESKDSDIAMALFSRYKEKVEDMNYSGSSMHLDDNGRARGYFDTLPANKDWQNDPNQSPDEPVYYRVRVENRHVTGFAWSEWVAWPKKIVLPGFTDCHVHTNPAKATPLPELWIQNWIAELLKPDWKDNWEKLGGIDGPVLKPIAGLITNELPQFSNDTTEQLGTKVLDGSDKALRNAALDKYMVPAGDRKRIVLDMPIDSEMAHYRGYDGVPVYETNENGEMGCWLYEGGGKMVWKSLPDKEIKKLTSLKSQLYDIQQLFSSKKGSLLSFFPMDIRHWKGIWTKTLDYLIQSPKSNLSDKPIFAIGYKLYTALGYRPDDYNDILVTSRGSVPQTKNLKGQLNDLCDFYETCEQNKIPITCHCSRGGIFAYDFALYYDSLFPGDNASKKKKMEYFHEYYVSPFAWERVLQKFPDLYLNLAHFGGEEEWATLEGTPMPWARKMANMAEVYPNFYIDLSYFLFKTVEVADCKNCDTVNTCFDRGKTVLWNANCPMSACREIVPAKNKLAKMLQDYPKLKEKLLFGTDWYLISGEEKKYGHYDNYFKRSIQMLAEIDRELLAYTMLINPKKFLNLEEVSQKIVELFGDKFKDFQTFVAEKMHDSIGKYYV
jgi:type VI secretion system Hcp family effector